MPLVLVEGHTRNGGTVYVPSYIRRGPYHGRVTVKLANKEEVRDLNTQHPFIAIDAYTYPHNPGVIYVANARTRDIDRVLSHETLHDVMNRMGEFAGSQALDARRTRILKDVDVLERTGMYRFRQRKH